MDFWDTTGILLDGCGLKLQRYDNQCHSLQHSGWIQRHCSKKQVGTVQQWCHPSGQCDTPHSPDDQWLKQCRGKVLPYLLQSPDVTPLNFHLIGPCWCLAGQPFQRDNDAAAAGMTNWLHTLDVDFFVLMHKFPIRSIGSTKRVIRKVVHMFMHVC
jgi:hypothetical protein